MVVAGSYSPKFRDAQTPIPGRLAFVGVGNVDFHDQVGRMPFRKGICLLVSQRLGADAGFGCLADIEGAIGLRSRASRPFRSRHRVLRNCSTRSPPP